MQCQVALSARGVTNPSRTRTSTSRAAPVRRRGRRRLHDRGSRAATPMATTTWQPCPSPAAWWPDARCTSRSRRHSRTGPRYRVADGGEARAATRPAASQAGAGGVQAGAGHRRTGAAAGRPPPTPPAPAAPPWPRSFKGMRADVCDCCQRSFMASALRQRREGLLCRTCIETINTGSK